MARAPALQAGGQRFESVILHSEREYIDMMEAKTKSQSRKLVARPQARETDRRVTKNE